MTGYCTFRLISTSCTFPNLWNIFLSKFSFSWAVFRRPTVQVVVASGFPSWIVFVRQLSTSATVYLSTTLHLHITQDIFFTRGSVRSSHCRNCDISAVFPMPTLSGHQTQFELFAVYITFASQSLYEFFPTLLWNTYTLSQKSDFMTESAGEPTAILRSHSEDNSTILGYSSRASAPVFLTSEVSQNVLHFLLVYTALSSLYIYFTNMAQYFFAKFVSKLTW